MIVGFSGYAQSGKDTAARVLIDRGFERRAFERRAFADTLRAALYALNPIVVDDMLEEWYFDPADPTKYRLRTLVDSQGWEEAKQYGEVRRLLQRLGTEVGRNILGENVWVDATMRDLDPAKDYVFTDVRFPNEADAIRAAGGKVIRIERGLSPVNAHVSETALDHYEFDAYLYNFYSVNTLLDSVRGYVFGGQW